MDQQANADVFAAQSVGMMAHLARKERKITEANRDKYILTSAK
jgi:hypothetical protein